VRKTDTSEIDMATEQELAAMRDRVASLEAAETGRLKSAAVARELGKYELAEGAREQLDALITPSISITKLSDGRDLLHDSSYRPLESVVAETLQRADFGHFLKPNALAGSQPAAPARQPAAPGGAPPSDVRDILPGETFGAAIVRVATSQRAAQGDPRLDLRQPMGLRPLPR
jgi:hypothetical protein